MLIDWFTVAAQAVNFLILVGLLRWLLYGRVIDAMDRREEAITTRLQAAEKTRAQAGEQIEAYERKQIALEAEHESLFDEVREQAKERRQELLANAHQEVDGMRDEWIARLGSEKEAFLQDLRHRASDATIALTRQTLGEMADSNLEERMSHELARRLDKIDEKQKNVLHHIQDEVTVRSAFELPDSAKDFLAHALAKLCPEAELQFQTEPELICGIELEAGGNKIGWNINGHLDRLEEKAQELLEKECP